MSADKRTLFVAVGVSMLLAVLIQSIAYHKTAREPFIVGVASVADSIENCQHASGQAG